MTLIYEELFVIKSVIGLTLEGTGGSMMAFRSYGVSNLSFSRYYANYTPYYKSVSNKVDYRTSHANRSSVSDSVTLTVGGSVELGAIVAKTNISAEVTAGVEKTISRSVTINVAQNILNMVQELSNQVEKLEKLIH